MKQDADIYNLHCLAEESATPYKKGENPFPWTSGDEALEAQLIKDLESENDATQA